MTGIWLIYVFVFLTGITIGSFLNVCIWRMPREESVVAPPSHCPACGYRLAPLDLIPLLSFLFLRQRCRKCGKPISWRYFIIELITGLVFIALTWACLSQDRLWDLPFYLIFAAAFIAIFLIDLEHMIIPDELVIAGGVAALLKALGETFSLGGTAQGVLPGLGWPPLLEFLAGAVAGALFFILIELLSRLLFRKEGMGGGDMKLGAAIGALLGVKSALLSFALAVFAGAIIGIFLMTLRRKQKVDYIPFGPFMVLSAFLLMLFPVGVWTWVNGAWSWWLNVWAPA
jgi:leader peptidase (prepilin peptidase) / N-methyltransferase